MFLHTTEYLVCSSSIHIMSVYCEVFRFSVRCSNVSSVSLWKKHTKIDLSYEFSIFLIIHIISTMIIFHLSSNTIITKECL